MWLGVTLQLGNRLSGDELEGKLHDGIERGPVEEKAPERWRQNTVTSSILGVSPGMFVYLAVESSKDGLR